MLFPNKVVCIEALVIPKSNLIQLIELGIGLFRYSAASAPIYKNLLSRQPLGLCHFFIVVELITQIHFVFVGNGPVDPVR